MDKSQHLVELDQIKQIINSFNSKSLKESLLIAHHNKLKNPNLNNIPQFHNIIGLINLRLNDFKNSILNFKTAIKLNLNFHTAYYNLALVHFNDENLEKTYNYLIKALSLRKDYKLARDKIIELLSFYQPQDISNNTLVVLNKKLKEVPYNIDFSKKISDKKIINYYNNCKKIVLRNLSDLSYNKVQIFRNKSVFLNCERHKAVFSKYKSIPKYCFECFKVVIESENLFDLLKVSLIFDQVAFFKNFNRKNMIDKRSNKDVFKSIIYCTSLEEVLQVEKTTKDLLCVYFDNKFVIESKRGCHEYALEYPDYKKIYKKKSELMSFPKKWLSNEKEFDLENTQDGVEKKKIVHDTKKGNSLHNFLVINNWFQDQKIFY